MGEEAITRAVSNDCFIDFVPPKLIVRLGGRVSRVIRAEGEDLKWRLQRETFTGRTLVLVLFLLLSLCAGAAARLLLLLLVRFSCASGSAQLIARRLW